MSNRINFIPTQFINMRTGSVSFGFRAYDDYGQTYDNTWELIPDDDMEFLKLVVDSNDETVGSMFEFAAENQQGVYVGEAFYEWDEYKHLLIAVGSVDAVGPAPGVISQ